MKLKWGIISCGNICHDFVTALSILPKKNHEVIAVAASDGLRSKAFAEKHGIPKCYDSYNKIAEDPDVDVAYVGVINTLHFESVKMLLEHGKHVLCEKPLAMNLKQIKELTALSKRRKLFLMEAIWSRCFPAYEKVMEAVRGGVIGDISHISCNFGLVLNTERTSKKSLGGSSLLDVGIYMIQFLTLILNGEKPDNISAFGRLNEDSVDTSMSAILKFPNEVIASVNCSAEAHYRNEAVIHGSKGSIKVCEPFWSPTKIQILSEEHEFLIPYSDRFTMFPNSMGLQYEAEHVRDCIMKGLIESPLLRGSDTKLIAEIMDEIRRQIGVGFPEDLE